MGRGGLHGGWGGEVCPLKGFAFWGRVCLMEGVCLFGDSALKHTPLDGRPPPEIRTTGGR